MLTTNNKRIAKNTILLYIRSFFLLLIGLYTSRVTLKVLGIDDYGIYQVVGGVVTMFSLFSSNLNAASQRFITYALGKEDIDNLKRVFSNSLTLHIVLGLIVVIILEILGIWFLHTKLNIPPHRLEAATYVMHISIITFFINIVSVPYNSLIIAHEKMGAFAYISLLDGILRLLSVTMLMYIECDKLILYSILYFSIVVLCRFIYSKYCTKNFVEARNIKLHIDREVFRNMFSFAGWNLVGSSALVLRNQGVDILLNIFFGVSINAAKGVSNQIQSVVHQLVNNFTTSVTPQLTKSVAKKDYMRTQNLIFHGGKMSFSLLMIIAIPFIVNSRSIMNIWLNEVPEYAVELTILSLIYLLSETNSRFLINSILANGKIRTFQITLGGIKLFAVPLTWLFLSFGSSPIIGLIVNISLQFICLFGEIQFSHKYINLDRRRYFYDVVSKCWIAFIISLTLSVSFSVIMIDNIIISIFISGILTCSCIWLIILDRSEKNFIIGLLSNKFLSKF